MKQFLDYMKEDFLYNWKNKSFGFYVSLAGFLCMVLLLILYPMVPEVCYNGTVIVLLIVGIILYLVFIQLRETGLLAAITLMVMSFTSLMAFVNADGLLDYFSTAFFSGFSLKAFFALPAPLYLSIIFMVLGFIIGSVSMYMPMNVKKTEKIGE